MSLDHEKMGRYLQIMRSDSERPENDLPGDFWVSCPVDGVVAARRVRQWTVALSEEMRPDAEDKWFIDGRYTSGNCAKCGLTLPVTRGKPVAK